MSEYQTLNKQDIINRYTKKCKEMNIHPYPYFLGYLEDTVDSSDSLDVIIPGNDKYNFNNRLKIQDIIAIVSVLRDYAFHIHHIDLRFNNMDDEAAKALSDLLKRSERLITLNLQGNTIGIEGAQAIAESLKEIFSLQYLNLNSNFIQTYGALSITDLLFSHQNLTELDLGNNEIDHDGMIGLASVLNCSNNTLEVLNLENSRYKVVDQPTAVHFGKMLAKNIGLQKLSLKKQKLRCDGIYVISEHLLENMTLRVLDLGANEISFKGCEALAKLLKSENCVLESLHLSNNKASDFGAKAISQAISVNKSLLHLDMTYNDIHDLGLTQLAQSLEQNSTLLSFKFFGNHFGQECLDIFYKLFQEERENSWFPDFVVYIVDDHYEMAYLETRLDLDIYV